MDVEGQQEKLESNAKANSTVSPSDHDSPTLETVSGFSSCSSLVPPEPFEPLFSVKFTGPVEKDGDIVKYTIKSKRISDGAEYMVQRQYEDFEWLDHCLVTSNPLPGLIVQIFLHEEFLASAQRVGRVSAVFLCHPSDIGMAGERETGKRPVRWEYETGGEHQVPPLPAKPPITTEMAEAKSKKYLGSDTKTLMGDQFNKDCLQLEQYLNALLSHRLFGKDENLASFLMEKEAPARAKIRKGLFSRISDSFTTKSSAHKDCEEFFQNERDLVAKYGAQIKETSEAFNSVVFAEQRVCAVLGHLATAFTLCQGQNDDDFAKSGSKLYSLFSEALEISRHGLEVLSYNDEITLGAYLELYSRFFESEKDMLYHRTCLMVEYENANKALDKAKPHKRDAAEEVKLATEKAFEDCSDVARQEIKAFHRRRIALFQESLEKFASAQLRTAKDVSAMLSKSLTALKQLQIVPETNMGKDP